MNIIKAALYSFDHVQEKVKLRNTEQGGDEIQEYIEKLIEKVQLSFSNREFKFLSETTEVRASLDKMLNNSFLEAAEGNAKRLLRIEKETQQRITHLKHEVQKGSLFQALLEIDNQKHIIICKAEHEEILDEADLRIKSGFPLKKQLYKAVMVAYNGTHQIEKVRIFDTNSTMSKYWWQDYLELSETYTPAYNTERSVDIIFKKTIEPIKDKHPEDYQIIRNFFVGYMRTHDEFNLTEIVDMLTGYEPIDDKLKTETIVDKLKSLPENFKFDRRFPIIKEKITKRRISEKIKLSSSIELWINDHVENITETIIAEEDSEGNKFIKIKTEEGYKWFARLQK
ncbi:hypothetical protein [Pseudanabaena sp. PCC 6802]|uniref:hypothetical protein n=1 Tax=Pseudanabaena sp. PCC 6802 TaxID=118173 RepID=UPI00034D8333|nr:hypothetical protein [Pseudanabaena sp. PCC 6802]